MIRLSVCIVLLLLSVVTTWGQLPDNARTKQITLLSDTLQLDSATIFKGSVKVSDGNTIWLEGIDYQINYLNGWLIPSADRKGQTVTVEYRVMLINLRKPYSHKNPDIIHPEFQEIRNPFTYPTDQQSGPIIQNDGLKLNGSISRGLAFGNNQDVVINSNLNLQLAGKLANDIDVLAAISDENNPIQPEGNTQQLQDFDRVFIQLSKQAIKLTVGDFAMIRPEGSYFMNYNKKSRGIQFGTHHTFKNKSTLFVGGEGALSRGRFARNIINGIEGNLGPYRLAGTNGELYIIIISGTEAVYLDGEKLKRGEQNDYIIDYNSGEVTFMPRRTITQYSRIVVEFQYSDRNYARSVFHTEADYTFGKYRLRANYYSEQDSKNQPFLQDLTDSNKAIMAAVGDRISEAYAQTAIATNEFSSSKILYRKIDTLGYTGVFSYAAQALSDTVFYDVKFSFVGVGKGDYVQAQSAANGRVFEWVAPVGGVSQGSYAPVTLLITPKRLQMTTVGVDINAIKHTELSVEVAQSHYDKNLYASTDKENDIGYGFKVALKNMIPLQKRTTNFWNIKTETHYEYVDQNFRYVERYRNVEFDRTWNRQLTNQQYTDTGFTEHIFSLRTSINKEQLGNVYYQLGLYTKDKLFTGTQQLVGTNIHVKRNRLLAETEFISTQNTTGATPLSNTVKRYMGDFSRDIFMITTGIRAEHEESSFNKNSDTLETGSFSYNQYTLYARNADTSNLRYGVNYIQRNDYQPLSSSYKLATLAQTVTGNIEYTQQNLNRLSASFTYREFEINDTNFTKLQPEKTILSRIEYDYTFLKRVFTANTYFQLGSGQELRRDFQFLEVPPGQGIYVWKDFDQNGVQGLNEFVLAIGTDKLQANFIKVFLPTNTSIQTNANQFNQTLNINPGAIWNNKNGFKKFMARWNNQTALRLDRKTTALDALDFVNPFFSNLTDSNLISVASTIRNTLFFNRSNPTFGFDLNYQNTQNKSYLTNGFDTRIRQEQGTNIRWNWSRSWGITVGLTTGERGYTSDFFAINNYNYLFTEIKPKLIYQTTQNLRATFLCTYFVGNNNIELGNQRGENIEAGFELRYNVAKQGVVNSRVSLYNVKFNGDVSSPLGYDMLQGFTVGNNYVWNINYQQRLANNLQITLSYDGRKSPDQPIVNIGRMEARYLF